YYPTYDNTGTQPVRLIGNTLTNVFNAFDFANGAKSVNYLSGNSAAGTGGSGTGVGVGTGSVGTTDAVSGANAVHGFATGVKVNGGATTVVGTSIYQNTTGVLVTNAGTLTSLATNDFRGPNTGLNGAGDADDNGTDLRLDTTAGTVTVGSNNRFAG